MTIKKKHELILNGSSLEMSDVIDFLQADYTRVLVSEEAAETVVHTRNKVMEWMKNQNKAVYGFNTGLGRLKDFTVKESMQEVFQEKILHSHAAGLGVYFEDKIVKLSMLLRANVFCRGNSGVRYELVERLVKFINHDLYPAIPQVGSLGVGDLQPMAHLGLCLAGNEKGKIKYKGKVLSAPVAIEKAGIEPVKFKFATKEALSLISGSTVLLAASVYAYFKARRLLAISDATLALSLEAMRGEICAYDPRIQEARGMVGQIKTAANVRYLLEKSQFLDPKCRLLFGEANPRIQDAVSFRSSPQVHGAIREVLFYIRTVLTREINASTDNPLIFHNEDGTMDIISGGNYHGAPLAYAMDMLGIVLTDLGVISERRSARFLDPTMSGGLPYNLVNSTLGLNTGFALIQANATAIVGEMRVLANPASIGSIPSKNNQEDHNSMGMCSARKVLQLLNYLEEILAIELLCAAQAIDIIYQKNHKLKLGQGTRKLYTLIRKKVPFAKEDVYSRELISKMIKILKRGEVFKLLRSMEQYIIY